MEDVKLHVSSYGRQQQHRYMSVAAWLSG